MSFLGRRRAARMRGSRGGLTAEFAIVLPLIIMLLLGIFEFGTAWRNKSIVTNSLRQSARIESQGTAIRNIDQSALSAFAAGTSKLTNMTLVRVIIYESADVNGVPPTACLNVDPAANNNAKGVAGTCNVYNAAQVATASGPAAGWASAFSTDSCTNSARWDSNWCSGSGTTTPRNNSFASNGPDYVGVYAEYTYKTVTGLLPQRTIKMSDRTVYRIEPAV